MEARPLRDLVQGLNRQAGEAQERAAQEVLRGPEARGVGEELGGEAPGGGGEPRRGTTRRTDWAREYLEASEEEEEDGGRGEEEMGAAFGRRFVTALPDAAPREQSGRKRKREGGRGARAAGQPRATRAAPSGGGEPPLRFGSGRVRQLQPPPPRAARSAGEGAAAGGGEAKGPERATAGRWAAYMGDDTDDDSEGGDDAFAGLVLRPEQLLASQ